MFKYRPYSHVHAWLHSTAHPQRKLPIIFCITPHTSPTYSPLTFSRTLFHLMETVTLLLSTVWIIVIDKLIEREMFQWTTQKTLFWLTEQSCSTLSTFSCLITWLFFTCFWDLKMTLTKLPVFKEYSRPRCQNPTDFAENWKTPEAWLSTKVHRMTSFGSQGHRYLQKATESF